LEEVGEVLDTNVMGVFNVAHAVLGAMRKRNSGHIVVISSSAAFYPYQGANAYGPSKAAVHMLCQCLRNDLGGTRVRVSEIAPAMVENTEFTAVRFRGDAERVTSTYEGLEVLQAEDVADAVYYCASAPARVNVDLMVIFPVQQHIGGAVMHRDPV
jgi:3-hydroxy acid dehydrogenase/malonic semialdehyde reductase